MKKIVFVLLMVFIPLLAACGNLPPAPTEESGGFTAVTNATSALQISVPETWEQQDGKTTEMASKRFATIAASTNLVEFANHTAPGIYLLVNSGSAGGENLDAWKELYTTAPENCAYLSRLEYNDSQFSGEIGFFGNCKDTENSFAILVANPVKNPDTYTLTLMLNAFPSETTDAMTANIKSMLKTFFITGRLP